MNRRYFAAEFVGTMILMLGGPGSAILAGGRIGTAGVAFAFGAALLVATYAVGPVSGCHVNPAVTLGLWVARKVESAAVPAYLAGQLLGAVVGGAVIYTIAAGIDGYSSRDAFAANLFGAEHGYYPLPSAAVAEIVFTALLTFIVLTTTSKKFPRGQAGLVVGLTLALIHLVVIPVDNASVNPARSLGTALFARGDALVQLWAFVVFPCVGALVGVIVWLAVDEARIEDTMLAATPLDELRDEIGRLVD
jgi:aquaporin Z